jgi:hypothetical protein
MPVLEPPVHGVRHVCVRRWLLFAALCVVSSGLLVLSASPARAAPLSDCTGHRGTVVAVDFAHWGGPIVRGCGIDQPSGYTLLHAAGFTTGGDAHDGAAFICRIGNQAFDGGTLHPTPSEARCTATPSTSAYWSYWVAPAGQNTWTYSPLGPMGDVPKPGEVELWMFGSTNVGGTRGSGVPRFPPSSVRAANSPPAPHTNPTPSTTAPSAATPAPSAPASRGTAAHGPPAKRRTATGRQHPPGPARKRPKARGSGRRTATGSPPIVSAQPTGAHTSSGSAASLVIGLCLALALAAGAARTVWRRRRYE